MPCLDLFCRSTPPGLPGALRMLILHDREPSPRPFNVHQCWVPRSSASEDYSQHEFHCSAVFGLQKGIAFSFTLLDWAWLPLVPHHDTQSFPSYFRCFRTVGKPPSNARCWSWAHYHLTFPNDRLLRPTWESPAFVRDPEWSVAASGYYWRCVTELCI